MARPLTLNPSSAAKLLAFDSSTNRLSVAVQDASGHAHVYQGEGGSLASPRLIGICQSLLAEAGLSLPDLDAIVVGVGPGAFTGLRAACAVGQGFALASHVPLLALDSLRILHFQGRQHWGESVPPQAIVAALDARMRQLYVRPSEELVLVDYVQWSEQIATQNAAVAQASPFVIGNLGKAFADEGLPLPAQYVEATPDAAAMLQIAQQSLVDGTADLLEPERLVPLYVRNKVAQTTAERMAAKATKSEQGQNPPPTA